MTLEQLQQSFPNQDYVHFSAKEKTYPFIEVDHPKAKARIALHGAHLVDFIPSGEKPVLFTSSQAAFKEGKAIRGGVPLCWPWFGAHPEHSDSSSHPAHGLVRQRFWKLHAVNSSVDAVKLDFHCVFSAEEESIIGGQVCLMVSITIADSLSIALTTTNIGKNKLTIGGALHSYFSISDINQLKIKGLEQTKQLDSLTSEQSINPEIIQIQQEYDRIFQPTTETVELLDSVEKRRICITKTGSKGTVVWNPWIEKSATMSDLGNQEYHKFICIEAINRGDDLRILEPEESHTLSQTISVHPL